MSLSRVMPSSFACRACRAAIARSQSTRTPQTSPFLTSWTPSTSITRSISSTARRGAEKHDPATSDPEFTFLSEPDAPAETSPQSTSTATPTTPSDSIPTSPPPLTPSPTSSPLPWYLQNRPTPTPQQAASIPDLPIHPPPLLSTLLTYLSNTAGLDDLQLLDLRHLDPPPALGPNLIMLLATARSEKHLHVSADRFCRWLRREHGLRADAAGLLGRNELKIKLRRKAKRMKLLANVGGVEPEGNIDDGIRTGWICCTVGKIEAHAEDRSGVVQRGEGFVGFSEGKQGVNIVVQMFTEEKRGEVDLETLWGGVLRTHERLGRDADKALKEVEEMEEGDVDVGEDVDTVGSSEAQDTQQSTASPLPSNPAPTHQFTKPRSTPGDVFPPASPSGSFQQLRQLHSVASRA